jgi:guanylate kinase
MTIFGFHIHKFKPVYTVIDQEFRGQKYQEKHETRFRQCIECKVFQEYFYYSQGGYYSNVLESIQSILEKDIITINGNLILPQENK